MPPRLLLLPYTRKYPRRPDPQHFLPTHMLMLHILGTTYRASLTVLFACPRSCSQ